MSGALQPLPHALSYSRRCYKGGHAIARSVLPHLRPMAQPSGSSRTALLLPTNLILPLSKPDCCTTVPRLVADNTGARRYP